MHKKMTKAITGSLMAAAMAVTTAAQFVAPMSASAAASVVGESTFDDGVGLPWHTCVTPPAKQVFEVTSDGVYETTIENVGGKANGAESRWDVQFRHRNLHIESGHTYKVSFDVHASSDGEMATHIADLKGENAVWISNHGGTECWNFQPGQSCGNCDNGHSKSSGNIIIQKGDNHFESEFTAKAGLEVAEWAFHYGGAGEFQDNDCFPEGTTLQFDNMILECTTCGKDGPCAWDMTNEMGKVTPRSDVRVNQVGYYQGVKRVASYATDEQISSPLTFWVKDSSGKTIYEGKGKPMSGIDKESGEYVQFLDFTDADIPDGADYYIEVDDKSNVQTNKKTGITYDMYISHPFNVNSNIYDGMLTNALNYYYQNRSGVDIKEAYITSGDKKTLAHKGGHAPSDMAYVQSAWIKSYGAEFDGDKSYQIDCVGGWYDAGDHGKYVVNGGISVWTLQNMYERALKKGDASKFDDDSGTCVIPEAGNGNPDILDEARVELEWMIDSMIVQSKDPYWGKEWAGMVYHKMHDHKWTGLATDPSDYADEWGTTRIVKPPSFAATLNMAATAAQAARLWKGIDDSFADKCLKAAEEGYAIVKEKHYPCPSTFDEKGVYAALDHAIGGGGYGDNYVEDDMYWAACELYATTGDSSYYDDLKGYQNEEPTDKAFSVTTSLGGGENNGSFSSFNWGCTAGLGTLSLYLNQDGLTEDNIKEIKTSIQTAAQAYIKQEKQEGMGIPYKGTTFEDPINIGPGVKVTGYEWGSNSFVVNNAIVMAYAYDMTNDPYYMSGVTTAMDYILGRNGNGFSYVTGYGEYHSKNPHHRYWSYELDSSFPMAPAGVMSGGPGAGLQDPYVGGLGYKRGTVASQKCFVDSIEAWSVNEVTINWNAPFAWVVSFLEDEAPNAPEFVSDDEPAINTDGQPGVTDPTPDDDDPTEALYGDANDNGTVEIADAVYILQGIADPSNKDYARTAQGELNADCHGVGNGVDAEDALAIQQYKADIVSSLPIK